MPNSFLDILFFANQPDSESSPLCLTIQCVTNTEYIVGARAPSNTRWRLSVLGSGNGPLQDSISYRRSVQLLRKYMESMEPLGLKHIENVGGMMDTSHKMRLMNAFKDQPSVNQTRIFVVNSSLTIPQRLHCTLGILSLSQCTFFICGGAVCMIITVVYLSLISFT
ncbi:hypothetical protein RF11_14018 [Thelohanellus kitauei]|uniref:Uncharacterized protein n=1 Tax=Thelohanellus kitauei TaxID=669202 RepID=A0A0C2MLZ3_THEKT|nr:hypothetical protein RF11_14018 [Thelohanellus kitauei]